MTSTFTLASVKITLDDEGSDRTEEGVCEGSGKCAPEVPKLITSGVTGIRNSSLDNPILAAKPFPIDHIPKDRIGKVIERRGGNI